MLNDSVWGLAGEADDPLLLVQCLERDGAQVLVATGELCLATGAVLEAAVERFCREIDGPLRIDLSGVSFMDAAGLSALVRSIKRVGGSDVPAIVGTSAPVARIIELTSTEWLLAHS